MYRNDHPTAGVNGEFLSEVPPSQPATKWPADHMTETQEEICNAIEGFGIPLQKGVRNQLFTAIQSAVGPAPTTLKNALLNASMEVAQFGSSGSVSASSGSQPLGVDRWRINPGGAGGNVSWSKQSFTGAVGEPPGNPANFLRLQVIAVEPGSGPVLVQRVESVKTLANSPVVVSFYAKCAAGTLALTPRIVQNFGSGGGASAIVTTTGTGVTVTTSWAFYTTTFNLPSIAGKTLAGGDDHLSVQLLLAAATGTLDVTFVQLERGSTPTSFDRQRFHDELLRCMRYRETSLPYGLSAPVIGGTGLENPKSAKVMGYQPTPGNALDGWEIWSLARAMRVHKRGPLFGEDPATYLTWHATLSAPTAGKVVVNGVQRTAVPTFVTSGHTGIPLAITVDPGAGPSVCEAHWVFEDPAI
jgi:hypothetical protein